VAIASAVSALISIVMFQIFPQNWWMQYLEQYGQGYLDVPARTDIVGVLITLVCGIPVGVVLAVIGFAILSGLLHLVARMLGGTGDYGKLAYMLALVSVPFTLLNSVLAPIPFVGCLSFLITLYLFVLQVLSIEAVHQFGIAKAVVTLIIPLVVLCLLVICIIVGLGSFIMIAAQEAFENIPQEFPMP
jgi:hypothetical protein